MRRTMTVNVWQYPKGLRTRQHGVRLRMKERLSREIFLHTPPVYFIPLHTYTVGQTTSLALLTDRRSLSLLPSLFPSSSSSPSPASWHSQVRTTQGRPPPAYAQEATSTVHIRQTQSQPYVYAFSSPTRTTRWRCPRHSLTSSRTYKRPGGHKTAMPTSSQPTSSTTFSFSPCRTIAMRLPRV